jgi:hypothetical protein
MCVKIFAATGRTYSLVFVYYYKQLFSLHLFVLEPELQQVGLIHQW